VYCAPARLFRLVKEKYVFKRVMSAAAVLVVFAMALHLRAAEPDMSTPKATVVSFAKALNDGDAAAIKTLCTGTAKQVQTIDAVGEMVAASKRMQTAAVAKWGDAGKKLGGEMASGSDELLKSVDKLEIKEEGDTATVSGEAMKGDPMKLRKIDGKWKIDLAAIRDAENMEKAAPMMKAMAKAADETATDIKADKYKTIEDATQAYQAKMMAAVMGGATTQPAEK
jgi:hypothetical protein